MSEPMSSGEIEDVLSSIRKLVSEDLRPAGARAKAAPSAPSSPYRVEVQEEADKLLLTPALRVVEDTPVEADVPEAETAPEPLPEEFLAEQPFAPEVAPETADAPREVEAPPVLSLDQALRSDLDAAVDAQGDNAAEVEAEVPPQPTAEPGVAPDPETQGIGAALSSIGSAVGQNPDEWESETGDGGFASLAWKAPQWVEEAEILAPATAPLSDYEALSPEAAEAAEAAARAEIEAAEQAAASDVRGAGAGVPPPFRRQDRTDDPEPETDLFAEDEPLYDEALLRDLVRDIIREELSGTLGERITRNVRKLVRAEIARAMTAREFE